MSLFWWPDIPENGLPQPLMALFSIFHFQNILRRFLVKKYSIADETPAPLNGKRLSIFGPFPIPSKKKLVKFTIFLHIMSLIVSNRCV